ncbi:hypothetical protein M979_4389 [Buttiauxella noackiae ATCC 51607]|uniref:Lipoprotein n=1 Tax=Buttiauxella noackiae ATCC 51607 TaxID=1354255 RepID=A0A1B7HGC8_9ENTR|nr:hypothetical protein [Buttiauxella noackiae]OAT14703.1 hypothetical protein M979_4389 [Buttiauxella noackiae ATCC 51607]
MNIFFPRSLSIVCTTLLMTACSGIRDQSEKPYAYRTEHSVAWNIINASGMDLYSDALVSQSQSKMFSRADYDFVFPTVGNDKLNEATLSLTPLLQHRATGMSVEDWQSNGILAWIPTELATTPQAASLVLSNKIEAAVMATLNESKREFRVRKGAGYNDWLGKYVFQTNASRFLVVKFADKDAGCELPKDDYFDPARKNSPICTFYTSFHDAEKIVRTPDLIGSNATGKSYFIRHDGLNGSSLSPVFRNSADHSDAENERMNYAFMQQVSSHLPAWVILYLSPHEHEGLPAVAFQQGKVHFFFREK